MCGSIHHLEHLLHLRQYFNFSLSSCIIMELANSIEKRKEKFMNTLLTLPGFAFKSVSEVLQVLRRSRVFI